MGLGDCPGFGVPYRSVGDVCPDESSGKRCKVSGCHGICLIDGQSEKTTAQSGKWKRFRAGSDSDPFTTKNTPPDHCSKYPSQHACNGGGLGNPNVIDHTGSHHDLAGHEMDSIEVSNVNLASQRQLQSHARLW